MIGGKRAGAGRKIGTQNLVSQNLCERILAEGISPLEFLLAVMRDTKQATAICMDAAKAVAPFVHPKLQSIEHVSNNEGGPPSAIEIVFVKPELRPPDRPGPEPPTRHMHQDSLASTAPVFIQEPD